MPSDEGIQTPLPPSLFARLASATRFVITGVAPETWFGPQQPLAPMAPPEVKGRQFDYPFGANINYTPRSDSAISFAELRALADALPLLRSVIETRKDQIAALDFSIRSRDPSAGAEAAPRAKAALAFLERPDRRHAFATWLRMLLEDMLVIDAATIYPRLTRAGALYSLDIVDGSTIKPLIGEDGRSPEPPDPAYQQVLHGVPAADFSSDELLYLPRNARAHRLYGMSPVEARDQSQIELYGPRVGSTITAHEICDVSIVASVVAQTILQRALYIRAHFTFKLSWLYCLLDPMDIVEITDANLGLSNYRRANHRDRGGRQGRFDRDGRGADGRRLHAGALSHEEVDQHDPQPRRGRRPGQSAADLRAAGGADRRRRSNLGRRVGRLGRRRRSELGRRLCLGLARRRDLRPSRNRQPAGQARLPHRRAAGGGRLRHRRHARREPQRKRRQARQRNRGAGARRRHAVPGR